MEDSIVEFARTGKFSMKDFLADIAEMILRSQVQRLIAQIFGGSSLFGGGSGNSNFAGGFANGGTIPSGQFGIVGENGPEFISGPANITPMGSGGSVTYNINAVDAPSFQQLIARDPQFIHAVSEQGRRGIPAGRR
jgi:lambda family phage tail tape measure protein